MTSQYTTDPGLISWYRLVYFDFVQQPVDYYKDLDHDILKQVLRSTKVNETNQIQLEQELDGKGMVNYDVAQTAGIVKTRGD